MKKVGDCMLIRSQNRDAVIILKSCDALHIMSDREDGHEVYDICSAFNMGGQAIGRYGTKERAKEVLEEIVVYYSLYKVITIDKVASPLSDNLKKRYDRMVFGCYDMPAE